MRQSIVLVLWLSGFRFIHLLILILNPFRLSLVLNSVVFLEVACFLGSMPHRQEFFLVLFESLEKFLSTNLPMFVLMHAISLVKLPLYAITLGVLFESPVIAFFLI